MKLLQKLGQPVSIVALGVVTATLLAACGGGGETPPSSFPGLTVADGAAYLASNQHVHKFNPATGKELWRYPAIGQTFPSGEVHGPFAGEPLRFKDWVIVGGTIGSNGIPDARLYAFDDKAGTAAWTWSVPGTTEQERREFADGVVTDGKLIFAANGNGTLYALDPASMEGSTPKLVWQFTTGNKLWSRPLVLDGRVYQSSLDHKLYALDAATGKEIWNYQAGASIASTPVIADGVLYFGAFDGYFHAVDAASGVEKWKSPVDAWVWTRATLVGKTVYFGDTKGRFYALNTADGSRRYTSTLGGSIHAQPLLDKQSLYVVSTDTFVYVLPQDGSGEVVAQRLSDSGYLRRLTAAPAVYEGALLLPLFDGDVKLTAIRLENRIKVFDLLLATATPVPAAP
ncbi:MAG: PQQ-binding-like beta-propeller repeat protein [Chloroflexi bacterium]|nr:PQQ-binding-like beta-propeller repeat protein [Chloroflexota bacterium]